MYFSCNVSYSSLPVFLPTILKEMGFTAVNAQGLSAPPYFVSTIVCVASTFVADRIQQRSLTIIVLSIIGGIGYVLLAACTSVGARYFGVFLAASGVFPAIANILPWVVNNQGSDTRRGMGIVMLNTLGQCGPLLGTNIFPTSNAPRYIKGQSICAAFMFFNAFLALSLRLLLMWENKKLDGKYGKLHRTRTSTKTAAEHGAVLDSHVGEENVSITYTMEHKTLTCLTSRVNITDNIYCIVRPELQVHSLNLPCISKYCKSVVLTFKILPPSSEPSVSESE